MNDERKPWLIGCALALLAFVLIGFGLWLELGGSLSSLAPATSPGTATPTPIRPTFDTPVAPTSTPVQEPSMTPSATPSATPSPTPTPTPIPTVVSTHMGLGVNYPINYPDPVMAELGFDWFKVFSSPDKRFPYRVLRRLDVRGVDLEDMEKWAQSVADEAVRQAEYTEAWEIGNEPNLGASFGWGAPPDPQQYTEVLCTAYERIKAADPTAIIVSGGLAPVGRVPHTWDGHQGYCAPELGCPDYYQDERAFLREMMEAGAGDCFDAFGYHPYGFGAPYDASPLEEPCASTGFCFRSVETIRRILVEEFGVEKPIWATEFGWILDPREVDRGECWDHPAFSAFQGQVVTPQEQAINVRGAYEWAELNYPWMETMFLFNYGFYAESSCHQMGFFDVKGRLAEGSLRALPLRGMPSEPYWSGDGVLEIEAGATDIVTGTFQLGNRFPEPLEWSAALDQGPPFLELPETSGDSSEPLAFTVDPSQVEPGRYTATIGVTVTSKLIVPVVEGPDQLTVTVQIGD